MPNSKHLLIYFDFLIYSLYLTKPGCNSSTWLYKAHAEGGMLHPRPHVALIGALSCAAPQLRSTADLQSRAVRCEQRSVRQHDLKIGVYDIARTQAVYLRGSNKSTSTLQKGWLTDICFVLAKTSAFVFWSNPDVLFCEFGVLRPRVQVVWRSHEGSDDHYCADFCLAL